MTQPSHFDISAAVVRQLGDELVSDEVTALVELVKNAYDADADFAHVVVETGATPTNSDFGGVGYISIDDNGMGMDREDIRRGWLMISLSGKREMKAANRTTPRGRTPLGDKGLGRLSTQKLGSQIEMDTVRDGSGETLHVALNWSAFTEDKALSSVPVRVEEATNRRRKGTRLLITGLRDPNVWHGESVERLSNDLAQIISPFEKARSFLVTLTVNGRQIDLGRISERVRRAAVGRFTIDFEDGTLSLSGKVRLAKLRGNQREDELEFFEKAVVASQGRDFLNYLMMKAPPVAIRASKDPAYFIEFDQKIALAALGSADRVSTGSEPDQESGTPGPANAQVAHSPFADPGPFHAEIDEFLLRRDESGLQLSGLSAASEIQAAVRRHAGIKVFRDGFAVKPYGINGEDWLRLGAQQTSASSWYGLRPHNVLGFVEVSEAKNPALKDKTDREGFVSNPYSSNFRRLMTQAVSTIGTFYEWIRRSYNEYRAERMSSGEAFQGAERTIATARQVASTLRSYSERSKIIDKSAAELQFRVGELTDRIAAEPLLSSSNERRVADLLEAAKRTLDESRSIFKALADNSGDAEKLVGVVASLAPRLEVVTTQLDDFAELAGLGLIAEALAHEVQNQTDRLAAGARRAAARKQPEGADLAAYAREVLATASALRRQIAHLGPSLRSQRDRLETSLASELAAAVKEYFDERWRDTRIMALVNVLADFAVTTNRGRLIQVLDNLVLNAEYWLKDKGPAVTGDLPIVRLEVSRPFLRISDNGPGVDASVEANLFEPFITLKPRGTGRGLGLFISKQILESMGCSITLLHERNAAGRRYVFELDLSGIIQHD